MKQLGATILLWSHLFITTNQYNLDVAMFRTNNCVFFCSLFGNTSSTALVLNVPFEDMDFFTTRHTKQSTSASIFPNDSFYNNHRGEWDIRRLFDVKSEPILDDRWEDLEIEKFDVNYIRKNLRDGKDFMISFSVRTKQNAEIIICNDKLASNYDCYWILLSAYNGTKSLIRKALGGINYDKDYAECTQPLSCNEKRNVITESEWRTFTISGRKNKFFQLNVYELGHSDPLLSYNDNDNLIENLTNMFFSNNFKQQQEKFYSYWKFLNYNFAYTNQSDKVLLSYNISRTSLCLYMSVALCNECKIDVSVSYKKTVREFQVEATKNSSRVLRWQTNYINIASNNTLTYKITFKSKINVANTTNSIKFWALNSIKECSNPDWKHIMYLSKYTRHPCPKSVNCQTIAPASQVGIKNFSLGIGNAKEYLAKRNIACKDSLFGDYCDSSELYVSDNSSWFENNTNLPVTENTNIPVTENRTLPVTEETSPSNIILKTRTGSNLGGNNSVTDNNVYNITKWAIISLPAAVFLVLLIIIVITSSRHYLEKYKYKRELLRIRNETPRLPSMRDLVIYDDVIDHVYEELKPINYANVFPNQISPLGHIYDNI